MSGFRTRGSETGGGGDREGSKRPGAFSIADEGFARLREGLTGARTVLSNASRRSLEEARLSRREFLGRLDARPAPSLQRLFADFSDEARSQSFLAAWATFAAGERLGRVALGGRSGPLALGRRMVPDALSPRSLALGAVAGDLYTGYATLSRRERLHPGLVGEDEVEEQHRRGAGRVLEAARTLGGSLIKAGQFASSRPDILPPAYITTLSTLQDRLPPRPFGVIRRAVERETGGPLSSTFASFEREPVAAASIAQVHRARLADGREVAVKVRYPEVASLIDEDLDSLEAIFDAVGRLQPEVGLRPISDYLRWTLPMELDLLREARAMEGLRKALSDRDDIVIPESVAELCTEGLLVMEYIEGVRVNDMEALAGAGIDRTAVARLINDAFADQLFRRGILHADPHAGNLRVQPGETGSSGPRLVLYDHGLTLRLEAGFIATLGRMVGAIRDADFDALTRSLGEAGLPVDEDTDVGVLMELLGAVMGPQEVGNDNDGEGALDLGGTTGRIGAGLRDIPPRLLLVGRAIALLDGLTRQLDEDVDAIEIVAGYVNEG